MKFISLRIKNDERVDFFSEFVSLKVYHFATTHGYAPIYLGKLIIFFDTISSCNVYCKFKVFFKIKNTEVVFFNLFS